jgi:hypothetical protein
MGYAGRTSQGTDTWLFGGLNTTASKLNVKPGEAQDLLNVDVLPGGGFTRRKGCVTLASLGAACWHFTIFYDSEGTMCFFAVVDGGYKHSRDGVTWDDVSGTSITWTGAAPIISTSINGFLILANQDFEPLVYSPLDGRGVRTLKEASLLEQPSNLNVVGVIGTAGTANAVYAVSAFSGRGEGRPVLFPFSCGLNIRDPSSTYPWQVTWQPVRGAAGYIIRRYSDADGTPWGTCVPTTAQWRLASVVYGEDSSSFSDEAAGGLSINQPLSTTLPDTAWTTPSDWESNGYPEGVTTMARGRNQRVVFWRRDRLWFSGSNDHLEYIDDTDAFDVAVIGGMNNKVRAITPLFDYTIVFTETNFFVYTGSTTADFGLQKILNTGSTSPLGIAHAGDDAYIWSQFGPTTISRVLSGADVESDDLSKKVRSVVNDEADRDYWPNILAYHDAKTQRVVWFFRPVGGTTNSKQLVYNHELGAWTKYSGWAPIGVGVTEDRRIIAATPDGDILELNTGDTDSGANISWSWTSADYDMRTPMRKTMPTLDLHIDKSSGSFSATVTVSWDFASKSTQVFNITESTVNGRTVLESEAATVTHYQLRPVGAYRYFRIKFEGSSSAAAPTIIGIRPDVRVLGLR